MAQKVGSIDLKAAKQAYDNASQTATNYISADSNGIKIASSNPSTATTYQLQTATSTEFVVNNASQIYIGTESNVAIARIGKNDSGNVVISGGGYVDIRNSSNILAHFGYESGTSNTSSWQVAPYFTFGDRKSDENYPKVGNYSTAVGHNNIASGYCSFAGGGNSIASGYTSFAYGYGCVSSEEAACSIGSGNAVSGRYGVAIGASNTVTNNGGTAIGTSNTVSRGTALGVSNTVSGVGSFAVGLSCTVSGDYGVAVGNSCNTLSYGYAFGNHIDNSTYGGFSIGQYNLDVQNNLFSVGYGTQFTNGRKNMLTLLNTGHLYINGTNYSNGTEITSDARIKTLISKISPEDGINFIRSLQPKKYYKDGKKELGFYAQDVESNELFGEYLVSIDNSGLYGLEDYRMLNYQGIIAPLVAAVQKLDDKINDILRKDENVKSQSNDG